MNKAIGRDGHELHGGPTNPPGELVKEEMEERNLTQKEFAKMLDIEQSNLSDILNGKRRLNASFALKLEKIWGINAELWVGLQARYELANEREKLKEMHA
ncbi:MAG: addiction module antidote protein, HigA family [Chitinophagaceae bacterium]|jgi:addiction module HigA family antidote|nr:MAG: addiction module antidote protein, HigA family [Chitinophagaceae bacterium]